MFILLFTMAFNMFLTKGDIIFRLGFLKSQSRDFIPQYLWVAGLHYF